MAVGGVVGSAVFLAKFCLAPAVMTPLCLAGHVVALGIAATLLGTPAIAVCVHVSWRVLRTGT